MSPRNEGGTDEPGGLRFWVGLAVGVAIMAWGVRLFLEAAPSRSARRGLATWIVGADLLHDLIVAPLVLAVGWLLARLVPARWRGPVHVGVVASASILLLAALPLVGSAEDAGNPTIQPLDYRTSTLTALALVWAAIGTWAAVRAARARRMRT